MSSGHFTIKNMQTLFSPSNTFFIGQVFNWTKTKSEVFCGVLHDKLLEIEVQNETVFWKLTPNGSESEVKQFLNLEIPMEDLLESWKKDKFFAKVYQSQLGVRILNQPIFECMMSFICSQNCHVSRIAKNIDTLKVNYGSRICQKFQKTWYKFPSVEELSKASIDVLQTLGLGYRAKYIVNATQKIKEKGAEMWLESLNEKSNEEVKDELLQLDGIGPKVADCILLFGFNRFDVVPIDTHMWKIAKKYYHAPDAKSLSNGMYKKVSSIFRDIFGEYAGWAHSIIFAASLKNEIDGPAEKKGKKHK